MNILSNKVRTFAIAVCLLTGATLLKAQQGQTGVGLRLGTDPGITVKHFLSSNGAIEGILHTGYRGFQVTGLYEWHWPLSTQGFKFYAGVGGHVGFFDRYIYVHHHHHYDEVYYNSGSVSLGPDGIIGLEYDFTEIPLNLGLDLHPAIDFHHDHVHSYLDGAFNIRVLF